MLNLAVVGGTSLYFTCYLILVYLFCFCYCVFQVKCLPFKFGGVLSYATPDLHFSFGVVFLDTLGTMCHFCLGVG